MQKKLLKKSFRLTIIFIVFYAYMFNLFSYERLSRKDKAFNKMIVYYLLGENKKAKEFYEIFKGYSDGRISRGYKLLLEKDKYMASNIFYSISTSRNRSLYSIIGYSLSIGEYSPYNEEYFIELAYDLYRSRSIVYAVYGWFYLEEGDLQSAKELIKKAIRKNPMGEYYFLLSKVYSIEGSPKDEEIAIKEGLRKGAFSERMVLRVASIYEHEKRGESILQIADEYRYKLNKETFEYLKLKALILSERLEEARKFLKALSSSSHRINSEKAVLYCLSENYKKAKKLFSRLEDFIKNNPRLSFYYGETLYKLKRSEYARWFLRVSILDSSWSRYFPQDYQLEPEGEVSKSILRVKFLFPQGAVWLNDGRFIVWGRRYGGGKNYLYIFDGRDISKKIQFDHTIERVFRNGNYIVFLAKEKRVEKSGVYVFRIDDLRIVGGFRLPVRAWNIEFSGDGSKIYIFDESYKKAIYESPFIYSKTITEELGLYGEKPLIEGFVYDLKSGKLMRARYSDSKFFKTLRDYKNIYSGRESYKELKKLIDDNSSGSFGDKFLKLRVFGDFVFSFLSTKENIFDLYRFGKGIALKFEALKKVKPDVYEIVDFLNERMVVLSGTNNLIVVDLKKKKSWRISKELVQVKPLKKFIGYIESKKQKPYVFYKDSLKAKKVSRLKGFTSIVSSGEKLFFVYKDLWLYRLNEKELEFTGIYPDGFGYSISSDGKKIVVYKNGFIKIIKLL